MGRAAPGGVRAGHANVQHGADRVRANVRDASARDRPRPPPTTPGEARWGRCSSCLEIRTLMFSGEQLEEGDDDDEEYDDEE